MECEFEGKIVLSKDKATKDILQSTCHLATLEHEQLT